jgi:hypothetical protein
VTDEEAVLDRTRIGAFKCGAQGSCGPRARASFPTRSRSCQADPICSAGEPLAALWDLAVHLDQHLAAFVTEHGVWVYALLFVIVFCETGLVVTPFLPGESLLFVSGTIAAAGGHGYRRSDGSAGSGGDYRSRSVPGAAGTRSEPTQRVCPDGGRTPMKKLRARSPGVANATSSIAPAALSASSSGS